MKRSSLVDNHKLEKQLLSTQEKRPIGSVARKTFSALVAGTLVTTMLMPVCAIADDAEKDSPTPVVVQVDANQSTNSSSSVSSAPTATPMPTVPDASVEPTLEDKLKTDPFDGADIALKVLKNEEVTYAELCEIDLDELRKLDKDLTEKVEKLLKELAPSTDEPIKGDDSPAVNPVDPSEPTGDVVVPSEEDSVKNDKPISQSRPASSEAKRDNPADHYPKWHYEGDKSFTMPHHSGIASNEAFIAAIGEQARQAGLENDLFASLIIAHSLKASNFGQEDFADRPHNNIFGLTKTEVKEETAVQENDSLSLLLKEGAAHQRIQSLANSDGEQVTHTEIGWNPDTAEISDYDTWGDSIKDYAAVMTGVYAAGFASEKGTTNYITQIARNPFAEVTKSHAATVEEAAQGLQKALGENDEFAKELVEIIDQYDLRRFDGPLSYETVEPLTVTVTDPETGKQTKEQRSLADLTSKATSYLGLGYVWGGTTPEGFDCSGLVQYCYREFLGITIPRTTHYQCLIGKDVDFADLHAGDLVFFTDKDNVVDHVGMYLGDGYYVESTGRGNRVRITAMDDVTPAFAKRVIPSQAIEEKSDLNDEEGAEVKTETELLVQRAAGGWKGFMDKPHSAATAR